ncbi:hypothetical protein C8034_v011558 [Colletotrichum sidae]|uniref:Uncharacterized protein n=1 Tax=Colletotrichum sidae TaxID=1347389 RepID=A0A4R8TGG7_9PEZI|nr:hypothetical protein C8034_v011558 [Colletotrichum sidae]
MRSSAPVSALLTLSMAVNAFPILDLLRPRTPTKSYLVVNVEGSPSTGVPPIVTVTKEPSPVTVTERVTDTLTEVPSSVRATSSTTIQVVNVDQTPERSTVTITPTQNPATTPTSVPTTTDHPAPPPSSAAEPDTSVMSSSDAPQPSAPLSSASEMSPPSSAPPPPPSPRVFARGVRGASVIIICTYKLGANFKLVGDTSTFGPVFGRTLFSHSRAFYPSIGSSSTLLRCSSPSSPFFSL